MTATTKSSAVVYGINKGETLHILISSDGDGPRGSDGTSAEGATDETRSENGRQTMLYRDAYRQHPRLAFRRYSEHSVTSPTEQTISGLGWNATWRSAQTYRPTTYTQTIVSGMRYYFYYLIT